MNLEDLANRVVANEQIEETGEAVRDWLLSVLDSIANSERLGPDKSVAKIEKGLLLRNAGEEMREIVIALQVTQKPHKVSMSMSRPAPVRDRNDYPNQTNGAGHYDVSQGTFLLQPGDINGVLIVPRPEDTDEQ